MLDLRPILTCSLLVALSSAPGSAADAGNELEEALATMDRHADFYRDNALRFSCDETIVFTSPGRRDRVLKLEYIYVHEGDRLADYRTRRRARRRDRPVTPFYPESQGLPFFLRRAYSWIFLFERAKRDMYRYDIVTGERIAGVDASVISFEPVPPIRKDLNDWTGRVWVDARDYRILLIEALKKHDHDQKMAFEAALGAGTEEPRKQEFVFTIITTEFDVEEKGVLLPGRVTATRNLHTVFHGKTGNTSSTRQLFRVTQTYSTYRFFGVKTLDMFRGAEVPEENR